MLTFGVDAGISSIGWAVINTGEQTGNIVACGTRMFDPPETAKERKPTNAVRREKRGMRRVIRRRRQRMNAVRRLLNQHGLLVSAGPEALALGLDPWALRATALDHALAPAELAAVLGHIARHRGFRSNAKSDRAKNSGNEASRMLSEISKTRERLSEWRTVGEMFARDCAFETQKRNRGGGFSYSILRDDQADEVRRIFTTQRRLGQTMASETLETAFLNIAFSQRPLEDSHDKVGFCPFVKGERRCARRSFSFEMFRLLSRLNVVRIASVGGSERRLTASEIVVATDGFGLHKTMSWAFLRKRLGLTPDLRFAGVAPEDEKNDFVARTGAAVEGTYTIRQAVGEAGWRALLANSDTLDELAAVLTFRVDLESIRIGIESLPVVPVIKGALMSAVEAGRFGNFTGAGHISAQAARLLIPCLRQGMDYSTACEAVGFDHAARPEIKIDHVRNPIAQKGLVEILKQMKVMVHEFGLPDRVHVELARDLGKSADERDEIARGIEKGNKRRDRQRVDFEELLGRPPAGANEMLRFELWQEQNGRCLYTDRDIPVTSVASTDNSVQVDHILPWSRFGDDSFVNKTLCFTGANAEKRGRTPFEWFSEDKSPEAWTVFQACVESCKSMKGYKKRGHYLRQNAAEVEERFKARNLSDTRYATRLALDLIARKYYPDPATRHVLARPGALTSKLRRGWGLEFRKKDADGKRLSDDRHHALDAIVVAACSESMLNRLTRAFQDAERRGLGRDFGTLDQPWDGFREQVLAAVDGVFVSRAERHRARGEAHAATIKQVRERDGKMVVFERRAIDALKAADLDRIKDGERNAALVASLRGWIAAGKPKDQPPLSPKGDPIAKVRLATTDKIAVPVRGGTADRGNIARVDVFVRDDAKGRSRFYLVPIYPHQIATMAAPPDRAVDAAKAETEWTAIDSNFQFMFSVYGNSLLEVTKPDGEVITGYFKSFDRSAAAIELGAHQNPLATRRGLGTRTLLSFRKINIDRLGRRSEIKQETRTWHGVVCT